MSSLLVLLFKGSWHDTSGSAARQQRGQACKHLYTCTPARRKRGGKQVTTINLHGTEAVAFATRRLVGRTRLKTKTHGLTVRGTVDAHTARPCTVSSQQLTPPPSARLTSSARRRRPRSAHASLAARAPRARRQSCAGRRSELLAAYCAGSRRVRIDRAPYR